MNNLVPLDQVDKFFIALDTYRKEYPVEAYIVFNEIKKRSDIGEKETKQKAIDYWHDNKELPGGFKLEERRGRITFHFEENVEWQALETMKQFLEAKIKKATLAKKDGICLVDESTGELLPTVTYEESGAVYSLKK